MEYIKSYGVKEGYNKGQKRFFVVCDGRKIDLHYANREFALKKAFNFVRACYKPFIRPDGENVTFNYMYKNFDDVNI